MKIQQKDLGNFLNKHFKFFIKIIEKYNSNLEKKGPKNL